MTSGSRRNPIRESPFWQRYSSHRYSILFYALLLTLIILPLASTFGMPPALIKLMLALCLFTAVMPNATRRSRLALFAGTLLIVVARWASDEEALTSYSGLMLALVGLVGLLAAGGALRFTLTSKGVDSETLYSALSTYLLAGLFLGQIYWSIEKMRPGSLVGPDPTTELTAIYYSFVTLSTLGYGDFVPRTEIARGVATLEVIGGQLFLAVLVARLIGSFTGGAPRG